MKCRHCGKPVQSRKHYCSVQCQVFANSIEDGACWIWTGAKNEFGYPIAKVHCRTVRAHRASYLAFIGQIPDDLELDHTCKRRACVNPRHLEAVTRLVNLRRSNRANNGAKPSRYWRAKTHCPSGHPYAGDNLYITPKGHRECRACRRAVWHRKKLEAS